MRADKLQLYRTYKVYTMNGISLDKVFMPTRFEQDKIKGITDDEWFSESMDDMFNDYFFSREAENNISKKEHMEYEEYELQFPEKYVKYIFTRFLVI